jgi:hypothetical protein
MMINKSIYLRDKKKYGWVEDPPDYYSDDNGWYKCWYKHNSNESYNNESCYPLHRTNGPARMWESGYKEYWLNGKYFRDIKSDEEWLIKQIIE